MSYPQPPPALSHPPFTSHALPIAKKSPQDYPDIITWCRYLDSHNDRNQDGVIFEPLSIALKKKGFVRITQLVSTFIDLKDLQNWLGIEVGTAILIMDYAKADVNAINAGKLFFPHLQNGTLV
jgi:hypothetical protein